MKLSVLCSLDGFPGELLFLLQLLSEKLHDNLDDVYAVGSSKNRCVLCSMVIQEILIRHGFTVDVVSVICEIWKANLPSGNSKALEFGGKLKVIIGDPEMKVSGADWAGHLAVLIHSSGKEYLFDSGLARLNKDKRPYLNESILISKIEDKSKNFRKNINTPLIANHEEKYIWGINYYINEYNDSWKNSEDFLEKEKRQIAVNKIAKLL